MEIDNEIASKIWILLVGDVHRSDATLAYGNLTSIVRFPQDQTLTKLIESAYRSRTTALLKDRLVAAWLIDRLRSGLGWEADIRSLNADITTVLSHITDFGDDGITETTLMICLLECFDRNDLASRSRLLYMMKKCNMQVPLTVKIDYHPSKLLTYVGCLNYQMDSFKNMVLCFGTNGMVGQGKDRLLQQLFPRINLKSEVDSIRSTTIELISHQNLQILNVNGSFEYQIDEIRTLAPYCRALLLSVSLHDINDDGKLNLTPQQEEILNNHKAKLIIVLRDVDQNTAKLPKINKYWEKYNVPQTNRYYLDNLLRAIKPIFATIKESIRQSMLTLVQDDNQQVEKLNPIKVQLKILEKQAECSISMDVCNVWQEVNGFVNQIQQVLTNENNLKSSNFPFSAVAEKCKKTNEKNESRRNDTATTIASFDSKEDPIDGYMKLINQKPAAIIQFFLEQVNTTTRMYFFEREIQAWKMTGEITQLRKEISEIQMNRNKPNPSSSTSTQNLHQLIKRLDSIEWGILDIWREIRIIRDLIHVHTSLTSEQKRILSKNYKSLNENPDSLRSITGRFATLFFSGFTVDAIDGTLLEYDHKFMEDAFRTNICRALQGRNEQEFFVISVLGTQSTGKSTLLNNLFGCDMQVSAGRTTRGENVTCISIDLPNCPVKNIVVQDFEGLMTMERGGSVFDKSICIYALASSDLVLLNTSRVIDAPTQELLKYVMFAFYHLGLQEYRKPKMTFVLRDMASSDLTEFSNATKEIENAMISYFQGSSTTIRLDDILDQIQYMALASALHRQDSVWQETFFALRQHIFDNIQNFSLNVPRDHQNWMAWINACDSIWSCVRKNLNLLDAGTLAEMHFKEQMDKYLNEAINSPETIQFSKQKIIQELDQEFEQINSDTDFDTLQKRMLDKIAVEFKQCEERVIVFFVDRVGIVQNSLTTAYESYKNTVLINVVAQSKEDTILILRRKLEDVRQKTCVEICLQRLVDKIEQEASRGLTQSVNDQSEEFERLWKVEEEFLKKCTDNLYQDKNIIDRIHDCYRVIITHNHRNQPNNFDQLIHPQALDLSRISIQQALIKPEPGTWERLKNFFRRDPSSMKKDDYFAIILNLVEKFINEMLHNEKSGFNKLNGTIRSMVQQLNTFIHDRNDEMIYDTKYSLSIDFFKAAHRRLYSRLCRYYQYEADKERMRIQSLLTQHKATLRENFMSAVTNTYDDVRTAEKIVESLQNALYAYATNENTLKLRTDDIDDILFRNYSDIKSPEALDKLCYGKTFLEQDQEKTYKFIIDRRGYLKTIWEEYYDQYTPLLLDEKITMALNRNYLAISSDEPSIFHVLRTAVAEWFQENSNEEKVSASKLFAELRANEKLNPVLPSSATLLVDGLIIQRVSFVSEILDRQWTLEKQKQQVREKVQELVYDLKDDIESRSFGCNEVCPYCGTKCSRKSGHADNHNCYAHLISGFGNCSIRGTNQLAYSYCAGDSWDWNWYRTEGSDDEKYTFAEHIKKFYPEWTIQQGTTKFPPKEQRLMFRALNKRLAEHFKREPHLPSKWPND